MSYVKSNLPSFPKTSNLEKDEFVNKLLRYAPKVRDRVAWMVLEHLDEYPS